MDHERDSLEYYLAGSARLKNFVPVMRRPMVRIDPPEGMSDAEVSQANLTLFRGVLILCHPDHPPYQYIGEQWVKIEIGYDPGRELSEKEFQCLYLGDFGDDHNRG